MRLIKSQYVTLRPGRPLAPRSLTIVSLDPVDAFLGDTDPEVARLQVRIDALTDELQTARRAALTHDAALKETLERGRKDGQQSATRQTAAALELLSDGIERAMTQLEQDGYAMEQLAVALATTALTRIFGESSQRHGMVRDIILHQYATISKDMLLHVSVSAQDFADNADLDDLRQQGLSIATRAELKSGDCEIKLRLGTLDVGVDQQWHKVRTHLEQLVTAAALI
jgi:flagellar biosynthesis/type III secretory pathway protein FliH